MNIQNQFNLSAMALAVATIFASGQTFAQETNEISANTIEGVSITSNSDGTGGEVFTITEGGRIVLTTNSPGTTIQIGEAGTATTVSGDLSVTGTLSGATIDANILQNNNNLIIRSDADNGGAGDLTLENLNGGGAVTSFIVGDGGVISNKSLTVQSGGASITGGIDNNSGGLTEAGAISGATTINASGAITGGSITDGVATLSSGALSGATTINASGLATLGSVSTGSISSTSITNTGNIGTATLDVTGLSTLGAVTQVGTANINATGTDATNIGTAGGATNIGSTASTNTVLGTTSVTGITNINTTGSLGTNIGNADSTTTVLGTTSINATGNGNTTIGTVGASGSTNQILGLNNTITATGINAITGATNNINGVTNINASISSATNINTGTSTSAVTIGNTTASATNTVNAYSGNTTLSLSNNTASLTAGSTLATNGITGNTSGTNSGGLTVYNSAQTIAAGTTIPTTLSPTGILTGKTYQNLINGNLLVDGNLYINGTLDYVSSNTANTTVIGSTTGVGASILNGATEATNGGTAIVLKGATGTQTVVDANGKLTNVVGTATQSTAALTLTNGIGNTHGLVITETQATLSGGTRSSSLTMGDNGATFSDSATGAPVQVHGVADGTSDFDAVNVRQFSSAIASVTAMANIPQVDQDKTVSAGMAIGSFMGKTALAAGMTYRFTKNGVLKGSISSALNSGKSTAVGIGAAWSY